jgi:hypothetical protein
MNLPCQPEGLRTSVHAAGFGEEPERRPLRIARHQRMQSERSADGNAQAGGDEKAQ